MKGDQKLVKLLQNNLFTEFHL